MRLYNQGKQWIYYCLFFFNLIWVVVIALIYRCRCSTFQDNMQSYECCIIIQLIWLFGWSIGVIVVSSIAIVSTSEYHSLLDQTRYQESNDMIINCIRDDSDPMSAAIASVFQEREKNKHPAALVSLSLLFFLISQTLWVLFFCSEYRIKDEVGRRNAQIAENRRKEEVKRER